MPEITSASEPRPASPLRLIAEAIKTATAAGHVVTAEATLGLVCNSTSMPRWEHDPRAAAISPLGALLLAHQPPIPLADEALAHLLGTSMIYVLGLDDGCVGATPSSTIARGPAARLYADGYTIGTELRALLHRKYRDGVPIARPADETTDRIPTRNLDMRRAAATRLLVALPVSAALELVAEMACGRAAEATGDVAQELLAGEAMLRELALDLRGMGQ